MVESLKSHGSRALHPCFAGGASRSRNSRLSGAPQWHIGRQAAANPAPPAKKTAAASTESSSSTRQRIGVRQPRD